MKKLVVSILTVVTIVAAPGPALAWHSAGHEAVAYIAYKHLTPKARARVDALLRTHPQYEDWVRGLPEETRGMAAFLKAANWPDVIQTDPRYVEADPAPAASPVPFPRTPEWDISRHQTWHYTNIYFSKDGTPLPTDLPPKNVLTQIEAMIADLDNKELPDIQKTYAIPWLVHLVGDVHQPMHAVTLVSKALPKGDRGGNSTLIEDPFWNLHAFWDGLLGEEDDRHTVAGLSVSIMNEHPQQPAPSASSVWVQESNALGREVAYGFEQSPTTYRAILTQDYRRRAVIIARYRVAQAGYRLAQVINRTLG